VGTAEKRRGELLVNEQVTYRDKTVPWSVTAVAVSTYDGAFVHVSCAIPGNVVLAAGDTVAIDVDPPAQSLRRYTVSRVDSQSFEFVAFRTERGPATLFLDNLKTGDVLYGQGPERPVKLPTPDMARVVVLGDETVIGTAIAVAGATSGYVRVAVKTTRSVSEVSTITAAHSVDALADDDAMKNWLTEMLQENGVAQTGVFLVGEQSTNQLLRQHAFSLGVTKDQLATRTFWRPDKAGLE
jgi:NADPH-dependent ferric siderophore reductase